VHGIEWAAGFYEGEGHFGVRRNPYGHPTALRMSIGQRTIEPLDWFYEDVGFVGKIFTRPMNRGAPLHVWAAGKTANAIQVAKLMWPLISERRQTQIEQAIDEFMSVRHVLEYDVSFVLVRGEKTG
jgi:hypothetical protein